MRKTLSIIAIICFFGIAAITVLETQAAALEKHQIQNSSSHTSAERLLLDLY